MSTKRVISINTSSKIYHKHGCRYVKKMLPQNRLDISKKEIRRQGFHCCRYCNSMNHHYNTEQTIMNHYAKNKNMATLAEIIKFVIKLAPLKSSLKL